MVKDKKAAEERRKTALKAVRKHQKRQQTKSFLEKQEIDRLNAAIEAGAPARGSNPLNISQATPESYAGARKFDELPISQRTKDALKYAKFTTLTAIQRAAIPHALAGRDVLGAAKTGSGKTLAFLLPVGVRGKSAAGP